MKWGGRKAWTCHSEGWTMLPCEAILRYFIGWMDYGGDVISRLGGGVVAW